jgi:hypothetical protein
MQYPSEEEKKEEAPPKEIEAFMLVDKEDSSNVLKSVGFTTTGNPRFIFFSEKEINRFLLGSPEVKKHFEVTKVILKVVQ